ncbi:MAG: Gfo/Idh/MocA family oxidoreductase [Streptococcaceae bacterium]|nr:Gfo/Idh/MocA family oxidoreductase [Streptococcaceae bacterium]
MTFKLGIIGTGWIATEFVEAAHGTGKYQLTAVYSRTITRALSFAEDYDDVELFDNLDEFMTSDLDVVYIASPNSFHYQHAKAAILAGKNVIVEKPAFSNPKEFEEIHELSVAHNAYIFEGARNIHERAFTTISDFLSTKLVVGADLTYAKYSSRMPALMAGELPNKWNAAMSGGILADLGCYLLYSAIGLFGKPRSVRYDAQMVPGGVDVSGIGVLEYGDFNVAIKTAGNLTSYLPSEIYTTDGTLILDGISAIQHAKFITHDGEKIELKIKPEKNHLAEEAADFAEIMTGASTDPELFERYESWLQLAHKVCCTSYDMRKHAGIHFPADD